jgi:hypothetical protein
MAKRLRGHVGCVCQHPSLRPGSSRALHSPDPCCLSLPITTRVHRVRRAKTSGLFRWPLWPAQKIGDRCTISNEPGTKYHMNRRARRARRESAISAASALNVVLIVRGEPDSWTTRWSTLKVRHCYRNSFTGGGTNGTRDSWLAGAQGRATSGASRAPSACIGSWSDRGRSPCRKRSSMAYPYWAAADSG